MFKFQMINLMFHLIWLTQYHLLPNLPEKFGRSDKIESLRYWVGCRKVVEVELLIIDAEFPLVPLDPPKLLPPHFPQVVTSLQLLQGSYRVCQAPREQVM